MPIPFTCPHCGSTTNVADQYAGQAGPCGSCGKQVTIPGSIAGGGAPAKSFPTGLVVLIVAAVGLPLVCVVLVLVALLLPAIQAAREAANRAKCMNNLKQISLALMTYHDMHQTFPAPYIADANGRPMHSWRVAILPYLEEQALYEQYDFDEPWDGPNNSQLHDMMPLAFMSCPTDSSGEPGITSYMAVVGNGAIFEEGKWISYAQITDGSANTIMVVEVAGSTTHWLEPRDLDLDSLPMQINATQDGTSISSRHTASANVVFADGSTHNLRDSIDPETLRRLILRNDNMPIDYGDF